MVHKFCNAYWEYLWYSKIKIASVTWSWALGLHHSFMWFPDCLSNMLIDCEVYLPYSEPFSECLLWWAYIVFGFPMSICWSSGTNILDFPWRDCPPWLKFFCIYFVSVECTCRSQKPTCKNLFSPFLRRITGLKLNVIRIGSKHLFPLKYFASYPPWSKDNHL